MPTGSFIKLEAKPTFREWDGRFTKASEELLKSRMPIVSEIGKVLLQAAQQEAPGEKYPLSLKYKTFREGAQSVGVRIIGPQPLTTFIIEGTKPHAIVARRARVLAFHWEKGSRGAGMYFFPRVWHPGTKPNPFHLRAMEASQDEAMTLVKRISTRRVFTALQGGGMS